MSPREASPSETKTVRPSMSQPNTQRISDQSKIIKKKSRTRMDGGADKRPADKSASCSSVAPGRGREPRLRDATPVTRDSKSISSRGSGERSRVGR